MSSSRTLETIAVFAFALVCATGQGKHLTNDPLTGLPLYPGTDAGNGFGNSPDKMPDSTICKSKMQGEHYSIYKAKVDDTAAWYSSHLSGFKKFPGYDSQRAQIIFRNSDGSILVVVTGTHGAKGENVAAYSVSYQRYQPGISEKTVDSIASRNIVCPPN
jgi:hypothetical protein